MPTVAKTISLPTHSIKILTTNITKIDTQSIGIIIKPLESVVSQRESVKNDKPTISMSLSHCIHQTLNSKASTRFHSGGLQQSDRKSGSAGMPRPISYAVFCLKKKSKRQHFIPASATGASREERLP